MSRLVCFDLTPGRRVTVREIPYRVLRAPAGAPALTLAPEDSSGKLLEITRNQLATLLMTEEAEFIDELDDPEPKFMREVTDISHMPLHRLMDWQAKVFLLCRMMPFIGGSPRGEKFRDKYKAAQLELRNWRSQMGVSGEKTWSHWTCYHDIGRWRANRYSLGALQRKGVEYCPERMRNEFYEEAAAFARAKGLAEPHLTAAQVHMATNRHMLGPKPAKASESAL
jgi:hypothetical protein